MPIKAIQTGVTAGLPLIATVHKGAPKAEKRRADGSTYLSVGEDLPFFRFEPRPGYEPLAPVLAQLFGKEPTVLSGLQLMGSTVEKAFPHWLEIWEGSKCIARSDGETVTYRLDGDSPDFSPRPHYESLDNKGQSRWKWRGTLRFVIPALMKQTGILGYVRWTCTSKYEIADIYRYLTGINDFFNLPLDTRGLLFDMGRNPRDIQYGDGEKRKNMTKSLVSLILNPDVARALMEAHQEQLGRALPASIPEQTLSEPEYPDYEDGFEEPPVQVDAVDFEFVDICFHEGKGHYGILSTADTRPDDEPVFIEAVHIPQRLHPLEKHLKKWQLDDGERTYTLARNDKNKLVAAPLHG